MQAVPLALAGAAFSVGFRTQSTNKSRGCLEHCASGLKPAAEICLPKPIGAREMAVCCSCCFRIPRACDERSCGGRCHREKLRARQRSPAGVGIMLRKNPAPAVDREVSGVPCQPPFSEWCSRSPIRRDRAGYITVESCAPSRYRPLVGRTCLWAIVIPELVLVDRRPCIRLDLDRSETVRIGADPHLPGERVQLPRIGSARPDINFIHSGGHRRKPTATGRDEFSGLTIVFSLKTRGTYNSRIPQ